jgi:hypothetical protein
MENERKLFQKPMPAILIFKLAYGAFVKLPSSFFKQPLYQKPY